MTDIAVLQISLVTDIVEVQISLVTDIAVLQISVVSDIAVLQNGLVTNKTVLQLSLVTDVADQQISVVRDIAVLPISLVTDIAVQQIGLVTDIADLQIGVVTYKDVLQISLETDIAVHHWARKHLTVFLKDFSEINFFIFLLETTISDGFYGIYYPGATGLENINKDVKKPWQKKNVSANFTERLQGNISLHSGDKQNKSEVSGSDVLIVSYQRSGSSFLSRVIGWRNDSFFWFEPLNKGREWSYLSGENLLCDIRKPSCIQLSSSSPVSKEEAIKTIADILKCDLYGPMKTLTEISFYSGVHASNWIPFASCLRRKNARYFSLECLKLLEEACRTTQHRVVKVLRIDLEEISGFFYSNPKLKIVYLLRDPRAVMNSHLNTAWYSVLLRTISFVRGLVETSSNARNGFHPFAYRTKLPWYVVKMVNEYCSDIYRQLGLREFKTEEDYKNSRLSSVLNILPFGI
ncbi:uncharacterized protein LOC123562043 [Mercenaria mercenaria]|uniref:uncharacterized protein LOC123562043 n=1 Tax=Mercenaria mercenaria TaxID=6596 RepID=UPI00234EA15A|nr:uncharacterized protein LOC123562043 [Mercenaria mercenaria]